jgi:Tfp pilus assembly protein PilN
MMQFNLLPDVKTEFIKAQRLKRLVIAVSFLVTAVAVLIFIALFLFVDVAQKKHLNDLSSDISTSSAQLKGSTNLNEILTIQNQLETVPKLQAETPKASQLVTYLTQLTPTKATISSLQLNLTANTLSITGNADSLATVNQFVDALKFTTYTTGTIKTKTNAFSSVVLSAFGYSSSAPIPASNTITFNFEPVIFENTQKVTLTVPSETSTRSIQDQPTLFAKSATSSTGGTQ